MLLIIVEAIARADYLTSYKSILFVYLLGILLMTASENEDNDILWCVNHDTFPFQKPMMETQVSSFETFRKSSVRCWGSDPESVHASQAFNCVETSILHKHYKGEM